MKNTNAAATYKFLIWNAPFYTNIENTAIDGTIKLARLFSLCIEK